MSFDKTQQPAIWKKAASTSIIPTTTIRNCNNDEADEESASSASRRIPKPSSATTTAATTIRSHSPRKIKTQTAKLVYNPSSTTTTKSNRDNMNENEKTVIVVAEVDEFQKKRLDRDREVKEIQEMLNEITKTPTKQSKKSTTTTKEEQPKVVVVAAAKNSSPPKQPTTNTTIQRSKTDTNLRRPTARKTQTQPRQESQTARCKSATHLEEKNNSPPTKQRQKTYNSEEAQRYMQEQKKKRRSLQMAMQRSQSNPAIDKDEIKKRLENLRQNTRKIVDKNVKIAKKKAGTTEDKPRREDIRNGLNKEPEVVSLKTSVREAWPERLLKASSPHRVEVRIENSKEPKENPAKTSRIEAWAEKVRVVNAKSPPPSEYRQDPSPLSENYKKIGLLRKPEFKDHSFSAIKDINMDKENLIADILTPQQISGGLPTSRLVKEGENLLSNVITPQILEQPNSRFTESIKQQLLLSNNKNLENKSSAESSLYGKSLKRRISPELDLQVPEAKLRSRTSKREKSVQADCPPSDVLKNNTELPYWLKPTLVQAYPYNFIMAVRKKLEAIANPPAVASSSSSAAMEQRAAAKKITIETPVSYPKTNRNNNVKRRIIGNNEEEEEHKSMAKSVVEKSSSNKENIIGESRSFSEVTSNFSSISLKLPESTNNTINKLKTKPQQFVDEDEATTISSSIFSSPEKKKKSSVNGKSSSNSNLKPESLSPLSMDNISNLHIKSKSSMISNITLGRGDDFDSTLSHRRVESGGSISHRSDGSGVDFSQLLDDFNRSLSQVIEVNQQLKSTLVKSQIFSPEKKNANSVLTTNRVELAEYVSDFEESSNADVKSESKERHGTTQSGDSSIHELQQQQSSKQSSSEVNTQKSSLASSSSEEVLEEEEESQSSFKNIQSRSTTNQSPNLSLGTQTFIVSSAEEKGGQNSTRTQTIHEEAIEESPIKENMSGNQYSLDSLETSQHEDYIKSHINTSRGDYSLQKELAAGADPPPPSYKVSSESQQTRSSPTNFKNSSMDSEFVRIFNKSDMEISVLSLNRSLSESTVNYSSIGMYEKLIQNETSKSDHLAALLKMREKALIDRTKGQIAWLEVQKERYKSKGLVLQISAIKKKQRGILLKMEKEREEIKKLLQRAKVQRDDNKLRIPEIRPFSDVTVLQQRRSGIQVSTTSQQKQQQLQNHQQQKHTSGHSKSSSSAIVRGYELETSRSLEQLLQKREEDLRRRREHVERLMEWHRRLDQEEAEVLQLERILLDYNNVHVQQQQQNHDQNEIPSVLFQGRNPNQTKMEKKLKDIDRSLRELSSISGADGGGSTDAAGGVGSGGEFVRTSGIKLNKLWRRLTSQRTEKFQPNKRYKLCKADVEKLYEDAKLAVLHEFGANAGQMEVFLGQTSIISTTSQPPSQSNLSMEIPQLNLNFSSGGQSAEDEDIMMIRGNYSPSAAEEGCYVVPPSTSSRDNVLSDGGSSSKRRTTSRNSSLSSSSAMQSLPECLSSTNSKGQRKSENAQNESIAKSNDSKSLSFGTKSANVSNNISINYILSSKIGSDPRATSTDRSEKLQILESSTKNERSSKNDSNSKTKNNEMEISITDTNRSNEIATKINQTNIINESTKISLVEKNETTEMLKENETEIPCTKNSTKTLQYSSNTNDSIEDLTSTFPELSNSSSSSNTDAPAASKTIETLSNPIQKNNTIYSLSDISKSRSVPEISSSYGSNSGCSTITKDDKIEKSIDTNKTHLPESISTESNLLLSGLKNSIATESGLKTKTSSDRTIVGSSTSLKESISKSCKISSAQNEPIDETTNQSSENFSNIKTEENLKTNSSSIKSQTLNSPSIIKSNISNENVPLSGLETTKSSEAELGTSNQNNRNVGGKVSSISGSLSKSTEDCASVSILKSLLNSTYNSSSMFASNQASSTAASDIHEQLRTNGHDFENWTTNTLVQQTKQKEDSPSFKDDEQSIAATQVSRTEYSSSLSYPPDETTLKSIKSIDNSTNSKHSIDQLSNQTPTIIASSQEEEEEEDIQNSNQNHDSKSTEEENIHHQSYSSAFEDSSVGGVVSSNQIRSSVIMSIIKSPEPFQAVEVDESEPLTNAFYESDFTEGEETNIDDMSLPKFETTGEEEQFNNELLSSPLSQQQAVTDTTDFEKRLIDLDVSLKDLDATFEKALSPEKTLSPARDDDESNKRSQQQQQNDSALMPDIISEVELRRRHQAMLENELKQFEHAVPYMYVREIPNKPPPPYVPPAHGSPMTTIFPSEERIKDITFRRTKELYCEILYIDTEDELGKKPPSVLDENITNIYERIILDICKEYLTEYKSILSSADPNNFHSSLAFFNPPDRLQCMQQFIYKEIRKNLAMDKNGPDRSQLYSVYGHRGKRDHIGEIIIQEMYEEDNSWSNFYVEEEEVLELIIEEIVSAKVRDICTEVLVDEVDETRKDSITPTPKDTDVDESLVEMCCNNST